MKKTPPNIVLILCDDLGYSDIGCYGAGLGTPNLDRIAEGGYQFSQAYNCARCCPSRASLMTGLYPHQAGIGSMTRNSGIRQYSGYLLPDVPTLPEILSSTGYRTMMSGKWHVGGNHSPHLPESWKLESPQHPLPTDRGFDRFYGTLCGAGSYYNPPTLMDQDRFIQPDSLEYHYTDATADMACKQINEAVADDTPFFSYVSFTAPHWPLHAPEHFVDRYREAFLDGWDILRNERHERLRDSGILSSKWEIGRHDETVRPWKEIDEAQRRWEALRMAVYTAMIDQMDAGIGRILDTLESHNIRDNTMIVFLSDNGGCAEFLREDGKPGKWPEFYRIPNIDGSIPAIGNHRQVNPGGMDSFMSYDKAWAHSSNSPFRLYKSFVHEGGISTPLIIQPPKKSAPENKTDRIRHETVHLVDLIPTILSYAGATYPEFWYDRCTDSLPGINLRPIMENRDFKRPRPLFWEHLGNSAVRDGDLKLVCEHGCDWELYRMDEDRTENNDVSDIYPEDKKRLENRYKKWTQWVGVRPVEEIKEREKANMSVPLIN